jgi:hypothetical protein
MRTIELTLFNFDELSEDAQQTALDNVNLSIETEFISEDVRSVLDAFCKIFPVEWKEYDIFNAHFSLKFTANDDVLKLSGIRLLRYLENNYLPQIRKGKYRSSKTTYKHPCIKITKLSNGRTFSAFHSRIFFEYDNCPLTGMYMDYDILEPILKFRKEPKNIDFKELINDCFYSLIFAARKRAEYYETDEAKREYIASNAYVFTEDGEIYHE